MVTVPSTVRAAYKQDGYYVAVGLADVVHLDACLRDIGTILHRQLELHRLPIREGSGLASIYANLTTLHAHDQQIYLATLRVFNKLKSVYDLFLAPSIAATCQTLGILLPLMHTLPIFHSMSNRLRIANGYHGFDAHQDWTGLQTSLNATTIWIPFHDVDRECFPLEVLPGSHIGGLCHGVVSANEYRLEESSYEGKTFLPLELRKGDVVFLTPFTIHRTGLTESGDLRIAISWRYEDALEDTFIERQYPFAQTRVVHHDLIFPGFPTPTQFKPLLK